MFENPFNHKLIVTLKEPLEEPGQDPLLHERQPSTQELLPLVRTKEVLAICVAQSHGSCFQNPNPKARNPKTLNPEP